MAKQSFQIEVPYPENKCFSTLLIVASELTKGKSLKDLFVISDIFDSNGFWWISSIDNKNHIIRLIWKWQSLKTIYLTIKIIRLNYQHSMIRITEVASILFDLFQILDIPKAIIIDVINRSGVDETDS